MGASCSINKNSLEYQTLKNMSGISSFSLDTFVYNYYQKNGRYPELDEIPKANSEGFLKKEINIKGKEGMEYSSIEDILNYSGSGSIEEAMPTINNKHRDIEVNLIPLDKNAIVEITKRPSSYTLKNKVDVEVDSSVTPHKSSAVLNSMVGKLNKLYGTGFIPITIAELNSEEWKGLIPESKLAKAFVYNGNIYINTDVASIDSPIHEMLHIFLGSMRYTDPDFYLQTVQLAEQLPSFPRIAQTYNNRTKLDLLEEAFVEEFGKYLAGQSNTLNQLPQEVMSKLIYNINRTLDSVLMGNFSVNSNAQSFINTASLVDLAKRTQSTKLNPSYADLLQVAQIARQTANIKQGLISKGQLVEVCS